MKIPNRLIVVLLCLSVSGLAAVYHAQTGPDLVLAAETFLQSLDEEQSAKARFDFEDEERFDWAFIPRERNGLPLGEMDAHQRMLAYGMMSAALGARGVTKAATIISLEPILAQIEGPGRRFPRDPDLYYFSVFGEPSHSAPWGWRLEGHHVAVNITVERGRIASSTPAFLGSNPAEVREGPRMGLRALGREEDLGRELLGALDETQKAAAVISAQAPNDIVTGNSRRAIIEDGPQGLAASQMNPSQRDLLMAVIREYVDRMSSEIAARTMDEIMQAGLGEVRFAWAGSALRGDPHYYRVHGPTFLIEYDNVQNNGNHVHSVFRDLRNDFGGDVLAAHYEAFPHTAD